MKNQRFWLDRRAVLTLLGGAALGPLSALSGHAQSTSGVARLGLKLRPASLGLKQGQSTPVWLLGPGSRDSGNIGSSGPGFASRVRRGDALALEIESELPVAVAVSVSGIDGAPRAEPLLAQPALPPNGKAAVTIPLRQAGTFLIDPRLLGDGGAHPLLPHVLVIEDDTSGIDRDEILLIEDWRLNGDGSALTPGQDPSGTATLYTLNRAATFDLAFKRNERVRLRIINACQRAIVALKIADHDLRVMAFDGEAAEPFIARDGQIVLGPGTRADAFVDATRPSGTTSDILLHDGSKAMPIGRILTTGEARTTPLPAPKPFAPSASPRINLKSAQRFDLSLDPLQWSTPASFDKTSKPVLRAKRGQTIVLAITNSMTMPATFHLHGHHFRLLDRMDDGWKPFQLDTLVFQPGQTQRIAFAADFAGNYLMEAIGNAWTAPRLTRWYAVD